MELTQNNVLNVDKKPGLANRLAPLSSIYSKRFRRYSQMLSFNTLEEGAPSGCNQYLGILVFTKNLIRQHTRQVEFKKWWKNETPLGQPLN